MIGCLQQSQSKWVWLRLQYVQHDVTNPVHSTLCDFRLFRMQFFQQRVTQKRLMWMGVKNRGHLIFRWLRLTVSDLLRNECGTCVERDGSTRMAWLGLPSGNWCQNRSRCQTARPGREACSLWRGAIIMETQSRGRLGEEGSGDRTIWRQAEGNCGLRSKRQKCLSCWLALEPQLNFWFFGFPRRVNVLRERAPRVFANRAH